MFQENVMDVILVLTQHVEEDCGFIRQDKLLLLEIFYYVFLGRDPEVVAKSFKKGSQVFLHIKPRLSIFAQKASVNIWDTFDVEYSDLRLISFLN